MRNRKKAVILFFFLLFLSACGGGEAERLEEENETLQKQVAALEEQNAVLQKQLDDAVEKNTALQAEIEQLETDAVEQSALVRTFLMRGENPIDPFYDKANMESGGSTIALSAVACGRAGAWALEALNAAEQLKAQLHFQEDRDLVDAYIAAAEEQAGRLDIMAIYPVSDLKTPYPERVETSGSMRSMLWGERWADIWRDTFYQLYWVMPDSLEGSGPNYTFVFDPENIGRENEP